MTPLPRQLAAEQAQAVDRRPAAVQTRIVCGSRCAGDRRGAQGPERSLDLRHVPPRVDVWTKVRRPGVLPKRILEEAACGDVQLLRDEQKGHVVGAEREPAVRDQEVRAPESGRGGRRAARSGRGRASPREHRHLPPPGSPRQQRAADRAPPACAGAAQHSPRRSARARDRSVVRPLDHPTGAYVRPQQRGLTSPAAGAPRSLSRFQQSDARFLAGASGDVHEQGALRSVFGPGDRRQFDFACAEGAAELQDAVAG